MGDNKWLRNSFVYLIIMVAVLALFFTFLGGGGDKSNQTVPISQVIQDVVAPSGEVGLIP